MGIRNISEVTKREIFSLFCDGYTVSSWIEGDKKIFYHYFGCLTEIEFLKKLYPISEIPSTDSRFSDAEGDIRQHTINNDDWEYGYCGGRHWTEVWTCPECATVFELDNGNV